MERLLRGRGGRARDFGSRCSRIDFRTLQLLIAICDERHIGRAARAQHIAASAVTKRVHDLENLLGVLLLYRHPKGVTLTPAGQAVVHHARELFGAVTRMFGDIDEFAAGIKGHVRIWSDFSITADRIAEDINRFCKLHPLIKVELREDGNVAICRAIATGDADIGVCTGTVEQLKHAESFPYVTDPLVAVMPANHSLASRDSVAFADLRNDEIVGMPMDPMLQTQIAGTSEGPVKPPLFRYQVSNGDAVRLLVAAGFGIAIQPACLVRQYETLLNIRGVPLSDTWATRQQRIIVRDSRSLSTGPSLFLRHVLLAGTGRISPSTNASFRNSQTSSGGGLACLK